MISHTSEPPLATECQGVLIFGPSLDLLNMDT